MYKKSDSISIYFYGTFCFSFPGARQHDGYIYFGRTEKVKEMKLN